MTDGTILIVTDNFVRASWQGAILALLALGVTLLFGKRLAARWRFVIWALVLTRFLLPLTPPSHWSVYRFAQRALSGSPNGPAMDSAIDPDVTAVSDAPGDLRHADFASGSLRGEFGTGRHSAFGSPWQRGNAFRDAPGSVSRGANGEAFDDAPAFTSEPTGDDAPRFANGEVSDSKIGGEIAAHGFAGGLGRCVAAVWLAGSVFFAWRLIASERKLRRRRKNWRPVDLPELETLVEDCRRRVGLRRRVRVYLTDETLGAASCGIVRPVVVISRNLVRQFRPGELRLVLMHELMHHKRLDPLTLWLAQLMRVLHWPNPLAWLAAARLRDERELAVDEAVVRHTGFKAAPVYGGAILEVVRQCAVAPPSPTLLGVQSYDKFLERRIHMILNYRTQTRRQVLFGLLLILTMAVTGLTDAKSVPEASPNNLPETTPETVVATAADEAAVESPAAPVKSSSETPAEPTTVTLRGRVVDEDGRPVSGASVRYFWFGYTPHDKTAISDEDGRFAVEIESKHVNPWGWFYAVSEDLTQERNGRLHLQEGSLEIPETTIILRPGRVITGKVVDQEGKPIEGATVAGADQTTRSNPVLTDAEGKFRFSFPMDADTRLQQVYAFKKDVGFDYLCTEETDSSHGITPPEKISDGPFQLTLASLKSVELKVVNEENEPLSHVKVGAWLITKEGERDSFNTARAPAFFDSYTDVKGIATLHCLPEWAVDHTRYTAYGPTEGVLRDDGTRVYYGGDDKRMEEFPEGQEMPTFVLPKQAQVKGTVKLPDGTPVPWARITRGRYAACGHGIRFTDANGEFELRENANDKFDLAVDDSKFGATPGVFAFDVGDGSVEKTLDFVLEKGVRLHGTVYGLDGKPADKEHQIFIYEMDPNPVVCEHDDKDCETCGSGESFVIRQTGNYGSDVPDGKYEYILPAVKRDYRINASLYGAEGYVSKEFTLTGDEGDYELDLHLTKAEEEESE